MKFVKYNIAKDNSVSYMKSVISTASLGGAINSSNEAEHAKTADKALLADKLSNPVNLWGNVFDGTLDVDGDITVGKIYVDTIVPSESTKVTIDSSVDIKKDLSVVGGVTALTLKSKDTLIVDGKTQLKDTVSTADVVPLSNNTYSLGSELSRFKNIFSTNINNSDSIVTKNLTVTGSAHFFELVIDKIRSVGGAALFTPADGFTVDKVEVLKSGDSPVAYYLYWRADDGEKSRVNLWKLSDLALCMSFNLGDDGGVISNKYWWSLVNDVGTETIDGVKYNFIRISALIYDGELNPEVGDEIVMLGSRDRTDPERGSALYISSYNGLDAGIKAPFIAQYKGITDFNLASHRQSYFDAVGAKFVGDFQISPSLMEEIISLVSDGFTPYISDGTDGFTADHWIVWDSANSRYKDSGILAKGTAGDNGYSPYIKDGFWYYWNGTAYIKGDKAKGDDGHSPFVSDGHDGYNEGHWIVWDSDNGEYYDTGVSIYADGTISYHLYPVIEQAIIKSNLNLDITLDYLVYKLIGNETPTEFTIDTGGWRIVFRDNTSPNTTNVVNGKYNNTYRSNYFTNNHTDIRSITVLLYEGDIIRDSRTIQIVYEPSATFEVNLELGEITSRVLKTEGDIGSLNGDVENLTDYVTEVKQTAEGIEAKVAANETNINGLTQRVTNIEATADGLSTSVSLITTELGNTTEKLAELEVTGEGLVSTVSKMNVIGSRLNLLPESNLTGRWNNIRYMGSEGNYNTIVSGLNGMNAYRAYIPATSTKLYNGLQWGNGKRKSIRLTVGKKYTLSVWAKANVSGSQCGMECQRVDSLFGDRVSGYAQSFPFNPTTTWRLYIWEFTANSEYNEIVIMTTNSSSVGSIQDVEFCMPLLTEDGITEYSLNVDDKDIVQGNLLDNTSDFYKGGNLTRVNGGISNFSLSNTKLIMGSSSVDMLEWLLDNKLEGNRDYILSLYAKTTTSGGKVLALLYNSGSTNLAKFSLTYTGAIRDSFISLSSEWTKVYIHFHTINEISSLVRLILRAPSATTVYIALPKLEFGAEYTDWTSSSNDYETSGSVSSKIELSAESIKLSVSDDLKTTGINIEDGSITLDAKNTFVNGNLALSGTFLHYPTHVNNTNITELVGGVYLIGNQNYYQLDFTKSGMVVHLDNNFQAGLPNGSKFLFVLPSYYGDNQIQNTVTELEKERVRAYIGQTFTLYNNSGTTIVVTGCSWDKGTTIPTSTSLSNGYGMSFKCECVAFDSSLIVGTDGLMHELVGWERTLPFKLYPYNG